MCKNKGPRISKFWNFPVSSIARGEWPSGLSSFRQVPEVKLGRVRSDSERVNSEAPTTHIVVLRKGHPMPGCGMHSGPKLAFSS